MVVTRVSEEMRRGRRRIRVRVARRTMAVSVIVLFIRVRFEGIAEIIVIGERNVSGNVRKRKEPFSFLRRENKLHKTMMMTRVIGQIT